MKPLEPEDFIRFDAENPQVYRLFCRFAWEAVRSGRNHFGVAAIWERIRWYSEIETHGDPWKVGNNWRAFYGRKFMAEFPETKGFFICHRSIADYLEPGAAPTCLPTGESSAEPSSPGVTARPPAVPAPVADHMMEKDGQGVMFDPRRPR
jgi:hypothetical protein